MAIFLFETSRLIRRFQPLTSNKPFTALLAGGLSLQDTWRGLNPDKGPVYVITDADLQPESLPEYIQPGDLLIYGGLRPAAIEQLSVVSFGVDATRHNGQAVAYELMEKLSVEKVMEALFKPAPSMLGTRLNALTASSPVDSPVKTTVTSYTYPEDLLSLLSSDIRRSIKIATFSLRQGGDESAALSEDNRVVGPHEVLLAPGAQASMSIFNTENGPIYIGPGAKIMEGCMLRGPLFIGAGTTVKMGTRLYGPVATAADCVLGGEIKNAVFHRGTNKGHEGYIGDSIIGAYCNFGAGSGGSNVKNTGGPVRLFDADSGNFREVGQKFGALMGDYTRIGVGTQLTTGSSIGLCCNLFGLDMPPSQVDAFQWGTGTQLTEYQIEKAVIHIQNWLAFKGQQLSEREIQILHHIFERTKRDG